MIAMTVIPFPQKLQLKISLSLYIFSIFFLITVLDAKYNINWQNNEMDGSRSASRKCWFYQD